MIFLYSNRQQQNQYSQIIFKILDLRVQQNLIEDVILTTQTHPLEEMSMGILIICRKRKMILMKL
jgi:hypothetical protein